MNLMNNGQMDRGNENPTQYLPWWLRKTTKKPQSDWHHGRVSPGNVSENPVTEEKRKKGWGISCDVGEATEGLKNELWRL